ncbi:pyridoxamine 5'-phosphate oxidase [Niastella koreensis]|uniref:Pyridoxamine 5'-phosphate oxidase-related FMN-binding protein n=2 Tax=Niastella koreensis TaxID=354356 RepID=G8TFU2_NIAKG|nr:pyridoxamine 5'-phosphate oxidase family protein [Niastella koreensis]AEW00541.1 pyridoxamine 5'-phosphate oxidase-related FMN-binding protein [Niastella koreensis GR20-10]OQP52398.1 pyridoxamine 5'-phosphate oxidase [Niastella koreensis]
MAENFASLAFTDTVKELQAKYGSRSSYARMERSTYVDGLTKNEVDFIEQRDSFYLASIGENHFPYIQHRGGPKGFLKVLDPQSIGCIDFRGNMQYISVGNIMTNNNVSLIMVDYPSKARLKVLAKAEIVEIKDAPALYESLSPGGYKFSPERIMVFHVEAYDWNCQQHITPRYTLDDVQAAFSKQKAYIDDLESKIKQLQQKLREKEAL